jgi:hypothetical protein
MQVADLSFFEGWDSAGASTLEFCVLPEDANNGARRFYRFDLDI